MNEHVTPAEGHTGLILGRPSAKLNKKAGMSPGLSPLITGSSQRAAYRRCCSRALKLGSRNIPPPRIGARGGALGCSAIRIRVASKVRLGACLAVPVHDAVVGVDLPVSVRSTLSMPKTEGGPCVWRHVEMAAVNLSPSTKYDPL